MNIQNRSTKPWLVLFYVVILMLVASCDRKPQTTNAKPKVTLKHIYDVTLEYPLNNVFDGRTAMFNPFYDTNGSLFLAALNIVDSTLDIYSWEQMRNIKSLDIGHILCKFPSFDPFVPIVTDDFRILLVELDVNKVPISIKNQKIIELDSSGHLMNEHDLYKLMDCNSPNSECYFHILADFPSIFRPLYSKERLFVAKVLSGDGFGSIKELRIYEAKNAQDLVIDLSNNGFEFWTEVGASPFIYQQGFFDPSQGESSRCVDSQGNIIYSSQSTDSVFVYSALGLHSKHYFRSSHQNKEAQSMQWEDIKDFRAMEVYDIENPVYSNIYHDPFRKYTIRVFTEPIPYENDVTINGFEDKPTWLVVADSAFNIIAEIPVPRELRPVDVMYFTKDHVIIEKHPENGIKTNKPVFAVYEWQDN